MKKSVVELSPSPSPSRPRSRWAHRAIVCVAVAALAVTPSITVNAQPVDPAPPSSEGGQVDTVEPDLGSPEPGEVFVPDTNPEPAPEGEARTPTGDPVVEKQSSREVTDPAEIAEIEQKLSNQAAESGRSAREAAPVKPTCSQDRFQSCGNYMAETEQYIQRDPRSPVLEYIGSWYTYITIQVRTPVRTETSESTIQVWANTIPSSFVDTIPGIFELEMKVRRSLSLVSSGWSPLRFPMAVGGSGYAQYEHYFDTQTTNNAVSFDDVGTVRFEYLGDSPALNIDPDPRGQRTTPQKIRCDRAKEVNNLTGCVNPSFVPTVNYSSSTFPFINRNIDAGQKATQYGIPDSDNPLVRGPTTEITGNRDEACPRDQQQRLDLLGPKPMNMVTPECDEYPFASSYQGGFGSTVAWVPKAENTAQGVLMGQFYGQNRVMTGDDFYVNAPVA